MTRSIPTPLTSRMQPRLTALLFALAVFSAATLPAATIVWSGASGTNWSTAGNWTGGLPGSTDDVMFNDAGTNALGIINNLVDASATIGSLSYGNSNNSHATLIAAGQTLTVNSNLHAFTSNNIALARNLTNVISGTTLTVNNSAAVIAVNQANTVAAPSRETLNLSGLDTFNVTARAIGLGSTLFPNSGASVQRCGGMLLLARTNVISLSLTDTLANYQTSTSRTNAIELSRNPGNNPGILCGLLFGQTNTLSLDSVSAGMDKSGNNSTASSALIAFNPAVTNSNPGAYVRGVGGAATTRVKWWSVGDGNASSSSSNGGRGTNDFSNGTVNMLIDVLSLGRECNAANTGWAGPHSGFLTFDRGTIDINTAYVGNQPFTQPTSVPGCLGVINVNGAAASLRVNTSLILGYTTGTSATALKTSGILNLRNGATALINSVTVGVVSTTNVITMTNATLILSNTIATPGKGLLTFATTNSTLQLNVTGVTNVVVTNLVVGGATNIIFPANVAVFASYPKQVTLIKYTTLTGTFNFGFGANVLPASAPGAYLSNNVANASIDLVLPTDPRPSGSAPAGYSGPIADVTFSVTPSGATPLTYQWRKAGGNISDGATGNGSTYVGTATASLGITNAQSADNGNYDLVITNAYGSFTSVVAVLTVSAGDVAPSITGPNNTTVIQSNNATLTASVSGVPAPALQWQKAGVDISGETNSSLTISNAQYPADEAIYSIIATNVAGAATNSVTLTVIVPPVITVQPVSLTVTNTQAASFSVTATGVPAPTYQWKKDGNTIANATNSTLNFASASSSDIATYSVVVQNAAGSVTSSNATLTVNSTMLVSTLSPSNGATGVFYDTPLSITFSQAPSLRSAGTIKIYAATNTVTPIDTINLALGNPQQRTFPGDGQSFSYNTVVISGNSATIYPHFNTLSSNQTYYVTIDGGVFTDASGAYFAGISNTNTWRFTTKPTGAANPSSIIVAADGSGDFVTVQGAVNSIPSGTNATPRVVNVRNGLYTEIVNIAGKHNVTFRGQSRTGTLIGYANNATLQVANGGTTAARMSFKVGANDIAIESLTLTNMTPQGGSQAEALMIASSAKRCIVNNCDIVSRQDTILANQNSSQGYFYKSTVRGNFDYIWGGGNLYFDRCTIHTVSGTGGGIITAARTDTAGATSTNFPWANPGGTFTANGMSFVGCTHTADAGVVNIALAGANGTAGNQVSWANCKFATNYVTSSAGLFSGNFVFWQYQNTDLASTPVSFSALTTLPSADARLLAATNISTWFYGWTPQLAPNILTNPIGSYLAPGGTVTLTVAATAVPEPTYQWQKNGTNVPGATSATLSIPGAAVADSGSYSVIVSNVAGTVTSSSATVTVNTSPVAGADSATVQHGQTTTINVGKLLGNDTDADGDTLSITAVSANASLGGGLVTYTAPSSGSSATITYTLSDGRGGTNIGTINVTLTSSGGNFNQLNPPVNNGNGTYTLAYLGIPGFNYALDESPDLVTPYTWYPVLTNTASGTGAISYTVPLSYPSGSFRARYVP